MRLSAPGAPSQKLVAAEHEGRMLTPMPAMSGSASMTHGSLHSRITWQMASSILRDRKSSATAAKKIGMILTTRSAYER